MKKIKTVGLLIMLCLLMLGCSNEVKDENNIESSQREITQTDKSGELKLSLEYNRNTDSQRGYINGYMGESENGYFFDDNSWISYWDKESGIYVPLCSNPDCEHKTMDCVAYDRKGDTRLSMAVYYYGGYIYKVGKESSKEGCYVNLYRIKEDGSEFEKCFTFYRAEGFNDAKIPKLCFHRGYLYYVIPSQSTMKLQRIKLGDNKSEIVYEMSGERQNLYRVRAYGNHIFFQAGNFVDDKMMEINAGIFEYDLTTDEVKTVLDGVIREYGIYGNNLYYDKDNCIYELNFSDMSSTKIIDNIGDKPDVIFGEDKIIIYGGSLVQIFEYDGKDVIAIPADDITCIKGLSNNILFGEKLKSGKIAYYDIASDDKKWKVLDLGIDI